MDNLLRDGRPDLELAIRLLRQSLVLIGLMLVESVLVKLVPHSRVVLALVCLLLAIGGSEHLGHLFLWHFELLLLRVGGVLLVE